MIMVKLQGGLGNQMFQYAFGLAVSKKLKTALYADLSFYQDNHGLTPRKYEPDIFAFAMNVAGRSVLNKFLHPNTLQKIYNKTGINKTTIYRENTLRFNSNVFDIKPPAYFEGFWQTARYFSPDEALVRNALVFKLPLSEQSQKIKDELAGQDGSISVHVRRGDYVSSKTTNELHGVCSVKYYQNAIALIKQRLTNPRFYFFSDEPGWVEQNLLPVAGNAIMVQHNRGDDSWQDMALMSKCRHHIIANSSFSWWGAWLNPDEDKVVIAPKNWFNKETAYFDSRDILPPDWLQVPND